MQNIPQKNVEFILPGIPRLPPIQMLNITVPPLTKIPQSLATNKKHLAMINGQQYYGSMDEQVKKKLNKQLQKAQKHSLQTQSDGTKIQKNLQLCQKCGICGYYIEIHQKFMHKNVHANKIIQNLLLGDKNASQSKKQLFQRNKVTHIVNAASQLPNLFESQNIKYCHLSLQDTFYQDLIPEAKKGADFISTYILNRSGHSIGRDCICALCNGQIAISIDNYCVLDGLQKNDI